MISQVFYAEGFWWDFCYLHFLRTTNFPHKQVLWVSLAIKAFSSPFWVDLRMRAQIPENIIVCIISNKLLWNYWYLFNPVFYFKKMMHNCLNFDVKVWKCIYVMREPIWFNGLEIQYTLVSAPIAEYFKLQKSEKRMRL